MPRAALLALAAVAGLSAPLPAATPPLPAGPAPSSATLQRRLDAAIAGGEALFELPPGDVQFPPPPPGYYAGTGPESLLVRNARHLVIRGGSGTDRATTLLFALGGGVRLQNCLNVTLQGVFIDYAPFRPYVQARIENISRPGVPPVVPPPGLPPATVVPCAGGQGAARPTPPCPAGWWASGSICYQGCPDNAQTRDPTTGRCLCGHAAPNTACEAGQACINNRCASASSALAQRWRLDQPWPGYISNPAPPGPSRVCLNVDGCQSDLIYDGCDHSSPNTCAGPSNWSIFEFSLRRDRRLVSAFGGCVASTDAGKLVRAACNGTDDAQRWGYDNSTQQLRNGGGATAVRCLALTRSTLTPPPPPTMRYTLQLAPRSLPPSWPDVAHGVLWSGATLRSKHEFVPSPGAAVHLHDTLFTWSAAIPQAEPGDWITFAGRDNFTVTIANSSGCTLADVTILSAPGFAVTEIDGPGGHAYRRVRIGSHGAQPAGSWPLLVGANADALHSVDVATGPLVEACDFSGNCDDFVNCHSTLHVLYAPRPHSPGTKVPAAPGAMTALIIDPRLVALGTTPLEGRVDSWYGTSSPLANSVAGDTISCFLVNDKPRYKRGADSWRQWGDKLRLLAAPVEVRNESLLASAAAVRLAVNKAGANPPLMAWKSLKLWRVELAPVTGAAQPPIPPTSAPAVICDVDRFGGRGAVLRNNFFHDLGTGGGLRWKSSASLIADNSIVRAGNASSAENGRATTGVEVSALQDWMEGPAVIEDVVIEGNRWVDCGLTAVPVTVQEHTQVTLSNNTAS